MTKEQLIAMLVEESWMLLWILLSAVLGFAIGFERKLRKKEAGIRTHTLVCFGAALMTALSITAFDGADGARVAAQIVSGVGFLGAGVIVFRKHEVRGLTTAAGVWATAGIGMACGAGMWYFAIGATIIMISLQCIQHTDFGPFKMKKTYSINICFLQEAENNLTIKRLFGVDRFNKLNINRVDGKIQYTATLRTDRELSSADLNHIMHEHGYILSIERCDD